MATRGPCKDKEGRTGTGPAGLTVPRDRDKAAALLVSAPGAGLQACVEVQLWSCPMAQPVKEEVCSWLSLQVFLPKAAGTQVNEDIAPVVQPQYTSRSAASTFSIPYNRVRNVVESN